MLLREADMPFTLSGIRPDILFNPHGLPSRMTVAQLIESLIGNICSMEGTHYDGTMFKENDIESYAEVLEQHGMNRYGYERMINGITGEFIDTLIFHGPTYYQRLQKFVSDAEYSVRHALTDALTAQPLDGQANAGGLRIGSCLSLSCKLKFTASLLVAGKTFELRETLVIYVI
jgi:DNA-directed RNA polymerase II subunit RPB2